ncbi:hypothetical protein [Pectobacterium aroidearum]|uniref:hypothetical protein n=1 Tax=Pectobacterium aroidearum TaxID=1201031 RepID=UPI0015F05D68|nr:hypothetical protein [Pectobacterium aroidearum]MBA5235688.1 hypothetical protein [Pectobacterium aroidearum]UUE55879.1 hypothetical protein L0Y27_11460 [Pectobacterium aroidearum]UUE68539.1 hypothetical protein L0Y21_12130 [Pectobacterium aroidearum]UUE72905.1 hypothetical protein L0Y20_12235 [Pectobacterium aroidearum]UUE77248.1 hypothetical protein L0Y24_11675 [Pectobacterium aroidearum]
MLTTKMKALLLCGGVAAAFGAGWYVQGLRWDKDIAQRDKQQSEDISTSQQAIIAGQSLQFHRYNEIARNANQHGAIIKANSNEKQIVYRTIIKRSPASRECVSDDVVTGLLDYAHRLRASAMRATASGVDAASVSTAASGCRLTYGQAVYWIDPLLTAIEQVNRQLDAIREKFKPKLAIESFLQ